MHSGKLRTWAERWFTLEKNQLLAHKNSLEHQVGASLSFVH